MKRSYDPTHSFEQFLLGVYAFWRDKAVSHSSSQKRMIDSTYTALTNVLSQDSDADQTTIEHAKQFYKIIRTRGAALTKEASLSEEPTQAQVKQLTALKEMKESMEKFIKDYKKAGEIK